WLIKITDATTLLLFVATVEFLCTLPSLVSSTSSFSSSASHFLNRILTLTPILAWLGWWRLATPEPIVKGFTRNHDRCWSVRIVATVALLCALPLLPFLDQKPELRFAASLAEPETIVVAFFLLAHLVRRISTSSLTQRRSW